jgi:LysR family nitrogen assimilation transcriptional regulator
MDLRQLEYFLHAANTLNITHAALRGNVSQPALSRQLRLLEEELSVRLFERKARGVVLTEAGVRLRDRVRILLGDVDRIREEVMNFDGEPRGVVRFAVSNSLTRMLTHLVVADFQNRYPLVRIRIAEGTSMTIRQTLVSDQADVALMSDREPTASLLVYPFVTESLCLIGPVEAKLDMRRPIPESLLIDKALILTPFPNSLRRSVDEILVRNKTELEPKIEVDTNSLMLELVRFGAGFCVLPYSGAHTFVARREVSAAPIVDRHWTWIIAVQRDRAVSSATHSLIEMIKERAAKLIGEGKWKTAMLIAK